MMNNINLAEQTRSLIDRLQTRQAIITNQFQTLTTTNSTLKKSKSVSFLDEDNDDDLNEDNDQRISKNSRSSIDRFQPRSILKKSDENLNETRSLEPFVVNIPNNISRVNIDEYLKDVQDQRRKCLNYSYTTDDDDDDDDGEEMKEACKKEEKAAIEPWDETKHWRSLFDEGNDRDAFYNTVRNSGEFQQAWTTDNVDQLKKRVEQRQTQSATQQQRKTNRLSSSPKKRQQQTSLHHREKVLLGYDVVAGLLDNEKTSLLNDENRLSESYLDELASFRKTHVDQSNSSYVLANEIDIADFSKEIDFLPPDAYKNSHTCIHSFTINDRLFTVPTNPDVNGQSRCPICFSLRKEPNSHEPQYARVSIPKYRVNKNQYQFRPQKRANLSDSATDSVALANHCLAGFNTARLAPLDKPAKSLDLRTDSGKQLELSKMTLEDVQRLGVQQDMCETELRRRSTTLRYHMNTLFQERLRHLRKTTNGPDNNASVISQIDVH